MNLIFSFLYLVVITKVTTFFSRTLDSSGSSWTSYKQVFIDAVLLLIRHNLLIDYRSKRVVKKIDLHFAWGFGFSSFFFSPSFYLNFCLQIVRLPEREREFPAQKTGPVEPRKKRRRFSSTNRRVWRSATIGCRGTSHSNDPRARFTRRLRF